MGRNQDKRAAAEQLANEQDARAAGLADPNGTKADAVTIGILSHACDMLQADALDALEALRHTVHLCDAAAEADRLGNAARSAASCSELARLHAILRADVAS